MNWSFCICTTSENKDRVLKIVNSIYIQSIPNFEIIVVGGENPQMNNVVHIPFDETIKPGWISKKKNIICKQAKFDNICLLHDYVSLDKNWYENFREFGEDWSHCSCRIEHTDSCRSRDWVTFDTSLPLNSDGLWNVKTIRYLNYDDLSMTRLQYQSGQCYCIKKNWALRFPLDETKGWGASEDVDHSFACRDIWNLKMNPKSIFRYLKPKDEGSWWPPRTRQYNYSESGY